MNRRDHRTSGRQTRRTGSHPTVSSTRLDPSSPPTWRERIEAALADLRSAPLGLETTARRSPS